VIPRRDGSNRSGYGRDDEDGKSGSLSLIVGSDMADILSSRSRYDEAIKQSRQIIDMDSNFAVAHYQLGQALAQSICTVKL
jgi:hypothetical protein